MASEGEPSKVMELISVDAPRKPHVLLAACGSVVSMKFATLCHCFCRWAEVKAVVTKTSLNFIDKIELPKSLILYTDEDEWFMWRGIKDSPLHIELSKWADIMVIAPLSANTLSKIAGGVCDNLLTCIVRAWDYSNKELFVAPAMNTVTWNHPETQRHIKYLEEIEINIIPTLNESGAMPEVPIVEGIVMRACRMQSKVLL